VRTDAHLGVDLQAELVPTTVTTQVLGAQWRRATVVDALAHLAGDERNAVRDRHLSGTAGSGPKSIDVLTRAHRRIVDEVPWVAGEPGCRDVRAKLLAGTDRPDDIDHVRTCAACRHADLASLHALLGDRSLWQVDAVQQPPPRRSGVERWRVPTAIGALVAILAAAISGLIVQRRVEDEPIATAQLVATELAPTASGVAEVFTDDAGFRIVIDVELPEPQPGFFYQAWVRRESGLVAIGTFSRGGEVVLWSGVPVVDGDQVTITLEPDDGDATSSGQRVLAGELTLGSGSA
jgi:hypothetical protein